MIKKASKKMRVLALLYFYASLIGCVLLICFEKYLLSLMPLVVFFLVMNLVFKRREKKEYADFLDFMEKNHSPPFYLSCYWAIGVGIGLSKAELALENSEKFVFSSTNACKKAIIRIRESNFKLDIYHHGTGPFGLTGMPLETDKRRRFWCSKC